MSTGSCPRCGQGHALASCPHAHDHTLALAVEPAAAGDLAPGAMVGEYRVTGLIGEGGMGKVYAGIHPLIGRKVAIKVISRALSRSDEGTARFLQEARAATALHHRHIVDVFAFGQLPDGRHYQVMELLEGETLRKVLDGRGALRLSQTRVITRAILSALDAAHRGGIIHRDIKPDNVMVTGSLDGPLEEIEVRILDFGLAKQAPAPGGPAVVTRLGFPMGTPAYMSPEQCRGTSAIDARADLYAAGVVLYEMLTGRVPFQSEAALEVMTMQIGQPAPPPSTVTPVPLALEQVVLRALAKQPGERFESAAEMLAAFENACRATPDWRPRAATPENQVQIGVGATLPSVTAARTPGLPSVAPGFLTPASAPPLVRPARGRWWLLALPGIAALAVLAVRWRDRPPAVEVPAPVAPAAMVEPPPRRPTTATLRVWLDPSGHAFLDGKLAGAGTEIELPDLPLGPHTLRAEAPGHLPENRTITLEQSMVVSIRLKPSPPARKRPAVTRHERPSPQEADLEAPINPYRR